LFGALSEFLGASALGSQTPAAFVGEIGNRLPNLPRNNEECQPASAAQLIGIGADTGGDPAFTWRDSAAQLLKIIGTGIFDPVNRCGQPVFEPRAGQAIKDLTGRALVTLC
jgi:hypothetical protein